MKFAFLFITLFFSFKLQASFINPPNSEQNPNTISWKKIDTEHFEIIFPTEVEQEAQRVAFLVEEAYPFVSRSLEVKPPKISLVLQNQSTISNGFVTLAPRRSEWYMTPAIDQELNNTEWLKTLAVHEFRHVVQIYKTRQGFNKYLRYFLGEIGEAIGVALTLPMWYLEGDAVGMETALTRGGRGRLPLFERNLRTLLLSGKNFDYDQAHLRSYDEYIPNHYVYGYFYTSYLRNEFGDLALSKLADESSSRSFWPLSFYNSYERLTEEDFDGFYKRVTKDLVEHWQEKQKHLKITPYEVQNLGARFGWTNYDYPQKTQEGKLVALKSGLSFIPRFVELDGDKERTLFYPTPLSQEYPYKLRKNRLAFLETEIDPRWSYRNFNKLKVYDLDLDKFILEIPKTKWRLAVLGHEADKIAVVNWSESQDQEIIILDLKGHELNRVSVSREQVITSLDWKNEITLVMVTKDRDDQKEVFELDLKTKELRSLLSKTRENLGFLSASDSGDVFIESPRSGIDNIYLLKENNLKQLTTSAFGAYAPSLSSGELIYNDYSVEGMNIVKKAQDWSEENVSSDSFFPVYERLIDYEDRDKLNFNSKIKPEHKVENYSQVRNAINFHSWIFLAPPLGTSISLVGYSRDILNKFSLSGGGSYNLNEQTLTGVASASWHHLYPIFDLDASYGGRKQKVIRNGKDVDHHWEEGIAQMGMTIPWSKLIGRFSTQMSARAFAKVIKVTNRISSDEAKINDGTLLSPGASFQASYLERMVARDLLPRSGISLVLHHEEGRDITGTKSRGSLQSGEARVYLPGVWYHHSLNQQFVYERQNNNNYEYASLLFYPRGTKYVFLQEMSKYSANYTMPLFYPDWHLSRYVYLKRVSMNLFYDELNGRVGSMGYKAASTGWEILNETYFLRLPFSLSWGIRGNYIVNGDRKNNYDIFVTSVLGAF